MSITLTQIGSSFFFFSFFYEYKILVENRKLLLLLPNGLNAIIHELIIIIPSITITPITLMAGAFNLFCAIGLLNAGNE